MALRSIGGLLQGIALGHAVTSNKHCGAWIELSLETIFSPGCDADCDLIMRSNNYEECYWQQIAEWGSLSMDGPFAAMMVLEHMQGALYDLCVSMHSNPEP